MGRDKASTVVMGEITGPHGISGEVKVNSHLVGNIKLIEGMKMCLLFPDGSKAIKRLIGLRETAKGLLLRIEGVTDRNEAQKLRGCKIELDASLLASAEDGEYYWRDLIGLEVFLKAGKRLGKVIGMVERGEQDLLTVEIDGREAMIPFIEPIIVSVDLNAGRLVVDPPEGLLELACT